MKDTDRPGYKNPPKGSQFKKGQSGNPNGRPKGTPNPGSIIATLVARKVTVRNKNGRVQKVPVIDAFIPQFMAKMLHGSLADQIKILQLLEKHAPQLFRDMLPPITLVVEFEDPKPTTEEA
jgi:hypothetical protein